MNLNKSESAGKASLVSTAKPLECKKTIYNILIFHDEALSPDQELSSHLSGKERTVFCHCIPMFDFAFEHAQFFNHLLNRKLLFLVEHDQQSSVRDILMKILNISSEHVAISFNQESCLSKCRVLVHRSGTEEGSILSEPSEELLNADKSVSEVEDRFKLEIETHNKVTGYFFSSNNVFSRMLYGHFLETDDVDIQESMWKLGTMDRYFLEVGTLGFNKRIRTSTSGGEITSNSNVELKVIHGNVNVSMFSVQMICSELIERFMLIPLENNRLVMLREPNVHLAFEICCEGEDEFIKVVLEVDSDLNYTAEARHYFINLLKKVSSLFTVK